MSFKKKDGNKQKSNSLGVKPIRAKKSFGQNFLVDGNYINKIISALDLKPDETIIEIGPGRGALTEGLVESGANVIAVEIERGMIAFLRERFSGYENFQLIEQDALKTDFTDLRDKNAVNQKIKLVANLPFNISTAILQKLIESREVFSKMVLMFQREVVQRISAEAGNSERGYLTILVEAYLEAEKLFDVPPKAFHPQPKVWSSVVSLQPRNSEDNFFAENDEFLRELISAAFTQKRKTILNNLKNAPPVLKEKIGNAETILSASGIEPNRRAETLTLSEWKVLTNTILQSP